MRRNSSQLVIYKEQVLKRQSGTNRSAKSAPCREQWQERRSVLTFVTRDIDFVFDQNDEREVHKSLSFPLTHPMHPFKLSEFNSFLMALLPF